MSKFSLFFFLYSAQTTHIYSYNSSSVLSTQTQKSFFFLLGIGYTISQLRVNCTVLYFEPSRVARLLSLFAIAARTTESTLRRRTPRRGRLPRHSWKAAAAPTEGRRRRPWLRSLLAQPCLQASRTASPTAARFAGGTWRTARRCTMAVLGNFSSKMYLRTNLNF